MTMTDLLSKEEWLELEKAIYARSGMNAHVYDADGLTFTGYNEWANELCPAVKANPQSLQAVCAIANQNIAAQAREERQTVISECDLALAKICVPVFAGGEYLGSVGACGHLGPDEEVETFLASKVMGMDEEQLEKLTRTVDHISDDAIRELAAFMEERVAGITAGK